MEQGLLHPLRLAGRLALWLLPAIVAATVPVQASAADKAFFISGDRQQQALDDIGAIAEDRSRRVQPDGDPRQLDTLAWQPAGERALHVGSSTSRWWLRVPLLNADDQPRERIVQMRHPTLDDVRFRLLCPYRDGFREAHAASGDARPFATRALPDRRAAFALTLPPHAECSLLVAVAGSDSINLHASIADRASHATQQRLDDLWVVLGLGMQCLLVLLCLAAAAATRRWIGVRFALAILAQAALIVVLSDTGYEFFWGPRLQQALVPSSLAITWWVTATLCLRLLPREFATGAPALLLHLTWLAVFAVAIVQVLWPDTHGMGLLVGCIAAGLALLLAITLSALVVGVAGAALVVAAILAMALPALVEASAYLALLPVDLPYLAILHAGFLAEASLLVVTLWRPATRPRTAAVADREINRRVAERTQELASTVAQLTSANRELDRLAVTDTLTGAYNRRFMDTRLARLRRERGNSPLSFILFDIDFFKDVNDRYGHPVGDRCLRVVAERVREELRDGLDVLCRYGGEEFAVILPDTDLDGAVVVAEKIRRAVAGVVIPCSPNIELRVTISLGISTLRPEQDIAQLVDDADHALYKAKRDGRNRWLAATA